VYMNGNTQCIGNTHCTRYGIHSVPENADCTKKADCS
jgi:hypothetical protein